MDLTEEVESYAKRHGLFQRGSRIVVGVSGGPDSVTLLHILWRLSRPYQLGLCVSHLNHQIRGGEADDDASFVQDLASHLDLPFVGERADVPGWARREQLSLEEAARRARYAFLAGTARQMGALCIAVGHNADDQAETVLMHLLRGAGPAGLRGMLPRTPLKDYRLLRNCRISGPDLNVIRPMLGIRRHHIESYIAAHELPTRFDRSNLDTTYFRNRLRHEVLPYLHSINPRITERLCNLAEVMRADYELHKELVAIAQDALLVDMFCDAIIYDLARWREQPLAIQRELVRRSAYQLRRTLRDVDFGHVEHAVEVARVGDTGAQAVLPQGLILQIGYQTLKIAVAGALHLPPERPWLSPGTSVRLEIPGVTALTSGWIVEATELEQWDLEAIRQNQDSLEVWIDARACEGEAVLRTRCTGDRFRPQGMHEAEVRLSDFLINAKVPKDWRDHLPLLVVNDEILWVTGVRLSEVALVGQRSNRVVHMRFIEPQT